MVPVGPTSNCGSFLSKLSLCYRRHGLAPGLGEPAPLADKGVAAGGHFSVLMNVLFKGQLEGIGPFPKRTTVRTPRAHNTSCCNK